MGINLAISKSAVLVAEKSEYSEEALEYSEEAELEDEMPDACKNKTKEKTNAHVILVGTHPMAKTGVVPGALRRLESWELVANDSFFS